MEVFLLTTVSETQRSRGPSAKLLVWLPVPRPSLIERLASGSRATTLQLYYSFPTDCGHGSFPPDNGLGKTTIQQLVGLNPSRQSFSSLFTRAPP